MPMPYPTRILLFVDKNVYKLVKLATFCRQTAPPDDNLKTVSTNPAAVQIGRIAYLVFCLLLLLFLVLLFIMWSYMYIHISALDFFVTIFFLFSYSVSITAR